jgi:extracellular factor (EF) 3-hydroxypalmitic acid methyl ester biosynthesis protein
MEDLVTNAQTVITCRNSQGAELTANLLHLKRYSAVFEVYNPYSILQLSEVLSDFRIMAGKRMLYHGKAVVSNLLNTGIVLVCEVTLDDGWVEMDFLSGLGGGDLGGEFVEYMGEWKRANQVENPFKLVVADMTNVLNGMQHWLSGVDVGIRTTVTRRRDEMEQEIFSKIEGRVVEEVLPSMEQFESAAFEIPEGQEAVHKSYVRRELHPLILCSPFVYRTFTKPLGYAGDYEMVNMMLRDPFEGASAFAKLLNNAMMKTEPVVAHRNRIDYLVNMLDAQALARRAAGRLRTKAFNLGCGPAVEVERLLINYETSDLLDFDLLDFNADTIEYTRRKLDDARMKGGRNTKIHYRQRSVHQILRTASQEGGREELGRYDVVYCAGLFDYLSQRVCQRLVSLFCDMALPGGLVVVTNVSDDNPRKAFMEYIVEWNLIYRGKREMEDLIPRDKKFARTEVKSDKTGVNLFLEIELPDE